MFCEKIKNAQAAGGHDTGETYCHHWLVTLEHMVAENGGTSAQTLAQHYQKLFRLFRKQPRHPPPRQCRWEREA